MFLYVQGFQCELLPDILAVWKQFDVMLDYHNYTGLVSSQIIFPFSLSF